MLPRDLPVVGVVTPQPNNFWRTAPDWVNHGTPHDYDNRVPILFWGTPFKAGRYNGRARAVDIAPTLAEVLGISPTEVLDGQVLRRALR
jgi:arylsulfatase A-like enzyme